MRLHLWLWDLLLSCPEGRTPESASNRGIRPQTVWHDSIGHNPGTYITLFHWALFLVPCSREDWDLQRTARSNKRALVKLYQLWRQKLSWLSSRVLHLLRIRRSHANAFYHSLLMSAYQILVNLTSGAWWPLGGIPTNLYLSVSTVTVPSWRRGFIPRRGFLSWRVEYVSSKHYCQAEVFCSGYIYANCGAIAVICKHDLHDCREFSAPFSPEMTIIVIDHDTNILYWMT